MTCSPSTEKVRRHHNLYTEFSMCCQLQLLPPALDAISCCYKPHRRSIRPTRDAHQYFWCRWLSAQGWKHYFFRKLFASFHWYGIRMDIVCQLIHDFWDSIVWIRVSWLELDWIRNVEERRGPRFISWRKGIQVRRIPVNGCIEHRIRRLQITWYLSPPSNV